MKIYVQLMIILLISLIGETISTLFQLPIPGSIIGMLLLFLALEWKIIRLRHISLVGGFLLANMTILFLPAAVGIMERFDAIAAYWLSITVMVVGALILNIAIIGLTVQFIKKKYEGDYIDKEAKND